MIRIYEINLRYNQLSSIPAEIPASVKEKILIASDFQYEKSLWPTPLREERKFFLDELHENLKRHEPGRVVHLTPEY